MSEDTKRKIRHELLCLADNNQRILRLIECSAERIKAINNELKKVEKEGLNDE